MTDTQTPEKELVVTGDQILCPFPNPIIGHGVAQGQTSEGPYYFAAVTGLVERIDKLITVRPHLISYLPEVGDVIVGRVTAIVDKKWKLDINARQSAALAISSINLPGGQRKRTDEDALQMRLILKENDLISAEVQRVLSDKSAALHTRSHRYGKLGFGIMIDVTAGLVPRRKHHFHSINDLGLDIILGLNGKVWIAPQKTEEQKAQEAALLNDATIYTKEDGTTTGNFEGHQSKLMYQPYPQEKLQQMQLESLSRMRNSIKLLDLICSHITMPNILAIFNHSIENDVQVNTMMDSYYMTAAAQLIMDLPR